MDLRRKPRGDKIYRGAYNYFKGDNLYAEEEFEVYKDRKELGMSFFGELHSRVATGEMLTVYVDYTLSKDYVPRKLLVEKTLGKEVVTEIFDFNPKINMLDYLFISSDGQEHIEVKVPPRFAITTPLTFTSMLFLKVKKEDVTAKNFYPILSVKNQWRYEEPPYQQIIVAERAALASENLNIGGQSVPATPYKVWDSEDLEQQDDSNTATFATAQVSKHSTIPYLLRSQDGLKIQVKYFNDLDKD